MLTSARALVPALLLALSAPLAACSSSDSAAPGGAGGSGGTGGSGPGDDGGDGGGAKECATQTAGQPPPAGQQCVKTVDATLVGTDGKPLADVEVTACGKNICNYAKSDASGKVHFDVFQYMDTPAFKVPGSTPYVQFAWLLPKDKDVHDLGTITLIPLPTDGAPIQDNGGSATTADQDVKNGGATLSIAKGTTVTIDTLTLTTPDQQAFRALEIPMNEAPPSVDASLGLETLWSLTPLDTLVAPAAKLTVPNTKQWAAGTTVELFLHGVDLTTDAVAPYGQWLPIGTATVGNDGNVVTDDGASNGVPELSLVGMRAKK